MSPGSVDVDVVGEYVSGVLPGYMCPSVWVVTDELVLNSSGKLDRRALPPVVVAEVGFVAPVSSSQVLVAQVFERVLGVSRVGLGESFFLLGGNSLSAMRVAAGVADVFGVSVSVRDVFDAPTVEELADLVTARDRGLAPIEAVSPRPSEIPLSFAQSRMWFINQFEPGTATYLSLIHI